MFQRSARVKRAGAAGDKWYLINKKLLPLKVLYFLLFSAVGCLSPFLPLYMHQIGFTLSEVGVMYSMAKFTNFLAQPIIGMVADKFQKHKHVLVISVVLWGLSSFLMFIIPTTSTPSTFDVNPVIICGYAPYIRQCETIEEMPTPEFLCFNGLLDKNVPPISGNISTELITCSVLCEMSTANKSTKCFRTPLNESTSLSRTCFRGESDYEKTLVAELSGRTSKTRHSQEEYSHLQNLNCTCSNMTNLGDSGLFIHPLYCKNTTIFYCELNCGWSSPNSRNESSTKKSSFWIFAVVFLTFSVLQLNTEAISNAIAYSILHTDESAWGKQRLYGAIGFALFAVTTSFIMDVMTKAQNETNYSAMFYIFGGVCFVILLTCISLNVSEDLKCTHLLTNVRQLIKDLEILTFLFTVFCLGIMSSAVETFKYLFLREMGAKQLVLGLSVVVGCSAEVPLLFTSGIFIKKFGQPSCLLAVCLAYSLRFISYSFITNAWYTLPIEPLHGITYGIMYAASSSHMNIIASQKLIATAQGLLLGVHSALGSGVGNVVTGVVYDAFGARWMFRAYAIFAVVLLFFYMSLYNFYLKRRKDRRSVDQLSEPEKDNIEVSVELLEAQGQTLRSN